MMQNNAGASYVYVCVNVVTGELVLPSPTLKITSAHSLKKDGVVGGQEYCQKKTIQTHGCPSLIHLIFVIQRSY